PNSTRTGISDPAISSSNVASLRAGIAPGMDPPSVASKRTVRPVPQYGVKGLPTPAAGAAAVGLRRVSEALDVVRHPGEQLQPFLRRRCPHRFEVPGAETDVGVRAL